VIDNVVCAFCGLPLRDPGTILIVVYPTRERDESQTLYSHRSCLLSRLHPEVPKHPALEEEV
jgi:hypothetical protein